MILLPLPGCWDYRGTPPHPAQPWPKELKPSANAAPFFTQCPPVPFCPLPVGGISTLAPTRSCWPFSVLLLSWVPAPSSLLCQPKPEVHFLPWAYQQALIHATGHTLPRRKPSLQNRLLTVSPCSQATVSSTAFLLVPVSTSPSCQLQL